MHSSFSVYSEKIIAMLGIGGKRIEYTPPRTLLSTDYEREKARQEIRKKVESARQILLKRIENVLGLEGKEVIIKDSGSSGHASLDFETVYSGLDADGEVFVSASDLAVPDGVTLLFMARKNNKWETEIIPKPNLNTSYFKRLASVEDGCSETEHSVLEKNGYWKG
ncbi:MAG: hypothetical protein ABIG39_07915 [Candidatus Micrarchaeota archaeon]